MSRISAVYLSTVSNLVKPYGLDRYFVGVLHICKHSGELTQQDISVSLKQDKVSTMRMLDYLSEKQLIERIPHEKDRRCHLIKATAKAKKLVPIIEEAVVKTNDILMEELTVQEKKAFKKCMNKLFVKLDTLPEPTFGVKAYKKKNEE